MTGGLSLEQGEDAFSPGILFIDLWFFKQDHEGFQNFQTIRMVLLIPDFKTLFCCFPINFPFVFVQIVRQNRSFLQVKRGSLGKCTMSVAKVRVI